jgi:hypothetical protein
MAKNFRARAWRIVMTTGSLAAIALTLAAGAKWS